MHWRGLGKRVDVRVCEAATQAPFPLPVRHRDGFAIVPVSRVFEAGATSVVLGANNTNSVAKTLTVPLFRTAIAVINVV